jgi:2-methylcitrate dehydratase PrpD
MSVTRDLVAFAAKTTYEDLSAEAVDAAKIAILNIIGNSIAGYQTRIGELHIGMAKDMGGGLGEATIIGDGTKVSVPLAAYANGNLGFALDYEDTVYYITHPGYITTASGLAMGEHLGSSGRDLLLAVILGYEILARIGMSMQPTPERGTQVWGEQYHPFASAITAGKLLGLDADALNVSFGIAGTYATVPSAYKYFGVIEETRPMREVKLGWGWMCMAGVVAAQSAKRGFKGGHGVLDGPQGFYIMAGSDRCDFDSMTKDLGKNWVITDTDYKPHPSIAWNHPPHDATKTLVAEHNITPDQVEKISIKGMGLNLIGDVSPAGAVDAQFSVPYTVVTTIMQEPLLPAMYSDEKLADPVLRDLLSKVELHDDPAAFDAFFTDQHMGFTIAIGLKSGETVTREVLWPRDQPAYGRSDIEAKFRDLAGTVMPTDQVERIMATIDGLDTLGSVGELTAMLKVG